MRLGVWGCTESFFFFFFHRWIERTAFTNGLFSAQDSGFTSCLHCDSKFCSFSAKPFGLQSICSIHILHKDIYFCEGGCDAILDFRVCFAVQPWLNKKAFTSAKAAQSFRFVLIMVLNVQNLTVNHAIHAPAFF